jgi:hypothetical protein
MRKRLFPQIGIVFRYAAIGVVAGADIKFAGRIPKNINPKQTRQAGLEPATSRLTAGCSTIELLPKFSNHQGHPPVNPDKVGTLPLSYCRNFQTTKATRRLIPTKSELYH